VDGLEGAARSGTARGDEITSEDERRASQIVSTFWLDADR
jgi:hypothetical protein